MNYTGILLEDAERFVEEETGFPDFVDRMIEKRDAEAAVQAAADTARSETWDAAQAEINAVRKSAADTRTREIREWMGELADHNDGHGGAITLDELLSRFARRFPVSDCEGDTDG